MTVMSFPSWLFTPEPALLRHFMRRKAYPLTDELVEAKPSYAVVRFLDGRETSVSTPDLALLPASPVRIFDTLPGGVFDDVHCNQSELSTNTMDSDLVANSNVDMSRTGL